MSMQEAIAAGADAFFDEKYGETVRTVRVEGYSHELCGGTHCRATGQIGGFVITGERSIGSNMRRIEALTGAGADRWLDERVSTLELATEAAGAQSPEVCRTGSARCRTSCARRAGGSRRVGERACPSPASSRRRPKRSRPASSW